MTDKFTFDVFLSHSSKTRKSYACWQSDSAATNLMLQRILDTPGVFEKGREIINAGQPHLHFSCFC